MSVSRRQFMATAAGLVAAGVVPSNGLAIDPIKRPGPSSQMKLSLAAYSFRNALNLKDPSMTLFEFVDLCGSYELDGTELTSYYFADTSDAYLEKLKARCEANKLAVSGVPVGNNFCLVDKQKYREQIDMTKAWIARAGYLGAETVRIFAGNLQKGDTLEEAQKRVIAAIEECCEEAIKHKVVLALENHGGITATPEQLLALVKPIKSPALGVNIDTGNFRTINPYADVAKIAPYGVCVQLKTEIFPQGKPKEEADLKKKVQILRDANYHGFVVLEYEASEAPKVAVPRYLKELRTLIG